MSAIKRLQTEYKQYLNEQNTYYSLSPNENNFLLWDVLLFGQPNTIFEGAILKANLLFTKDYPNKPPQFIFNTKIFHPNIFDNGKVCISILHNGIDDTGYEHISERWNPSHSINSILMSIIVVLTEPNLESPANLDASLLWRDNYNEYKKLTYKMISKL